MLRNNFGRIVDTLSVNTLEEQFVFEDQEKSDIFVNFSLCVSIYHLDVFS